jgi:CheY-like chemotaxis protein
MKVDIRAPESRIFGDPTQLHQILMNLCTNAHHAMKNDGGILEVVLDEVRLPDDAVSMYPGLGKGNYVRLSVSDTGHGIDQKNLEKIFDPYFTTKEAGEGTGLGLAVVHGIVKEYGGDIRVYSEEGKGTKFDLYFPRVEHPSSLSDNGPDAPARGGSETILFIDDEQLIAGVVQRMLEKLGYTVVAATSPEEALEKFEQSPDTFDLVITDKTMPRINGFSLAKTVKTLKKAMPVILCTGLQEQEDAAKIQEAHIDYVLTKPLRKQDLAAAIRAVLDTRSQEAKRAG